MRIFLLTLVILTASSCKNWNSKDKKEEKSDPQDFFVGSWLTDKIGMYNYQIGLTINEDESTGEILYFIPSTHSKCSETISFTPELNPNNQYASFYLQIYKGGKCTPPVNDEKIWGEIHNTLDEMFGPSRSRMNITNLGNNRIGIEDIILYEDSSQQQFDK